MLGQSLTIPGLAIRRHTAGADLNFAAGQYGANGVDYSAFAAVPGAGFARSGAGTARSIGGALSSFATGEARITDRGLLLEQARTNKVAIFNANPTVGTGVATVAGATLSVVDDTAALASAGLSGVVTGGKVFRIDLTGGPWRVSFAGAAGNTQAHVGSIYWRGTGAGGLIWSGKNTQVQNTAPAAYGRLVEVLGAPSLTTETLTLRGETGSPGNSLYLILPQLEEGAEATSPIVTTGASVARGGDSASFMVPPGCASWAATYNGGLTTGGMATPGATFDLVAGRPWLNGYLQRLTLSS